MLAFPVVLGAVINLGVSGRHLVEGVERLDPLAAGEVLDLDAAVGHVAELLGEALRPGAETRKVSRPGGYHDDLDALLRDGRERDCRCCDAGSADRGLFHEAPSLDFGLFGFDLF